MMAQETQDYGRGASVYTHERFSGSSRGPGPLQGARGDGTFDGMDPWQQSVETRLGELRGDVRQVLYATVGGAAFLLAAFAGGFLMLQGEIRDSTEKVGAKVDALTGQVADTGERAARIEGALERNQPRR